jgi:hypothetical protein
MTRRRTISARHAVNYMVYHHVRATWLQKNRRAAAAEKHKADFQIGWEEASVNERASVDFITKQMGVISLPHIKEYEPYPLPLSAYTQFQSKWPKEGRRAISVWLPQAQLEAIEEKTRGMHSRERPEWMRDLVGTALGISPPKPKE